MNTEHVLWAPGADSASEPQSREPEPLEFPLRVLQRVLGRTGDPRKAISWSMAEVAWTPEDKAELLRWAQSGMIDLQALRFRKITLHGTTISGMDSLGLTFLAQCSDIAQRNAVEGDMWWHVYIFFGASTKAQPIRRPWVSAACFERRDRRSVPKIADPPRLWP